MPATRLDQTLLAKIAKKIGKSEKYVRELISKRASRQHVASEAAQVVWAKELGLGVAAALRRLEPHVQEQVRFASSGHSTPVHARAMPVGSRARHAQRAVVPDDLPPERLLADATLRSRCAHLLKRPRHWDTVYREATTILEDRIRRKAGRAKAGLARMNPDALVGAALHPDHAVLVVSTEQNEQLGFHNMCKGIVQVFRHPSHHGLDDEVRREDALKFCGFIDVLLGMLEKAEVRGPSGSTGS